MVKQGILITPVLGEVLTNLAPLRMKHSASVPAYHKGKPTWLSLYLFACALTHRPSLTLCKGVIVLGVVRTHNEHLHIELHSVQYFQNTEWM